MAWCAYADSNRHCAGHSVRGIFKSLALAESDQASALVLWRQARGLDPESTTLICHEGLALFHLGKHEQVLELGARFFPSTQGWSTL